MDPNSYKIRLELYTSEAEIEISNYRECLKQFRPRCAWGSFEYRAHISLRYTDSGPSTNLDGEELQHPQRYLVILPKEPDQKVYWILHDAKISDCLSDGQTVGYWQTKQTEDGRCIHILHGCPSVDTQLLPAHTCGQLFRIVLGDTPHLLNYREPCGPLNQNQGCFLRVPLPLLWGLAAVQLNDEYWDEHLLPQIVSGRGVPDTDLKESIVECPRDEIRLVSIQIQGRGQLDKLGHMEGFVTIPSSQ